LPRKIFKCNAIPALHFSVTLLRGAVFFGLERHTLKAKHVVSIRRNLDGQFGRFLFGACRVILRVLVELDAEIEAQTLELVGRETVQAAILAMALAF